MSLAPQPLEQRRRSRELAAEALALFAPGAAEVAAAPEARDGKVLLIGYALYELTCQLLLLLPAFAPVRVALRAAAFAASLGLVFMLPGKARSWHPARAVITVALAIVGISALNPLSAGPLASLAHFCLYLSIVGPLFWVSRLKVTERTFLWILIIFWAYYTVSAGFGVLQMYFPGRFDPPPEVMTRHDEMYTAALTIKLASGEKVFRPMGLTDTPGGAAMAGFYATLIGLGIAQSRPLFRGARVLALGSVLIGMMVLYLSHVRSLVVALGVALVTLVALLGASARFFRLLLTGGVIAGLAVVGYDYAAEVGGEAMVSRLGSLFESKPSEVYYSNRGIFLEEAFTKLLPQFPLGGGLGRWGMINAYFAPPGRALWVEIQWSGWLIDGGVPLCLAMGAAILVAALTAARIALSWRTGALGHWAAVVAAYSVGVAATAFNATPFAGTTGVEFWFILAVLFQAAYGPDGPLAAKSKLAV
jgi:hypothetical protein